MTLLHSIAHSNFHTERTCTTLIKEFKESKHSVITSVSTVTAKKKYTVLAKTKVKRVLLFIILVFSLQKSKTHRHDLVNRAHYKRT